MMQKKLNEIQENCLDIFKVFNTIVNENNLSYFGIGGTCLGTIRHKGFIPWDDDIDVAMPIDDLENFIKIFNKDPIEGYEIYTPWEREHFVGTFIKLIKSDTTYIEKENILYPDTYKGIGIDIMPIFGMPKNRLKQNIMARWNSFLLFINRYLRSMYRSQQNLGQKIIWILLCPLKLSKDNNIILKQILKNGKKYRFNNSDKVLFAWRRFHNRGEIKTYKSVFDLKDFISDVELPFENVRMRVPIGYDSYLKRDFGDYMKLPPIEKRVSIHNALIIDTKKSYKDYIGKL